MAKLNKNNCNSGDLQPLGDHISFTNLYISLGANLPAGQRAMHDSLRAALADLADNNVVIQRVSPFYKTPCFPEGVGPDYVNAAAKIATSLTPEGFLSRLHDVEESHGRTRFRRWESRVLDLDLLAFGQMVLPDLAGFSHWRDLPLSEQKRVAPTGLVLPHPRLHERAFVLVPLVDIAPDWCHPVLGLAASEMLARLPADQRAAIHALPPF